MNISVCKVFCFDAAHFLPRCKDKCSQMHGHTWKLEVKVLGPVGEEGMVVDFVHLKNLVNDKVINLLDHTLLNDTIGNPTCEDLLVWIWMKLSPLGGWMGKVRLESLKLWETPDSYAEIRSSVETVEGHEDMYHSP